jgi:hypothetical protein
VRVALGKAQFRRRLTPTLEILAVCWLLAPGAISVLATGRSASDAVANSATTYTAHYQRSAPVSNPFGTGYLIALPDARTVFEYIYIGGLLIGFLCFAVAFAVSVHAFRRMSERPEGYTFWTHIDPVLIRFAVAVGILIVVFGIGRFLYPVLTLNAAGYSPGSDQLGQQTGQVLAVTQNLLNLVAIVLTLTTIGGAIFGYLLRRNVEAGMGKIEFDNKERIQSLEARLTTRMKETEEVSRAHSSLMTDTVKAGQETTAREMESIRREAEKAIQVSTANLTASYSNIILTADLALTNLPDFTYTQQIPIKILHDLRILERTFVGPSGGRIWSELVETGNEDRIRYAMGLYYLGMNATPEAGDDAGPIAQGNKYSTSAVEHLVRASKTSDSDLLKRNILIRLFQAYRQKSMYKKAEQVLDDLRRFDQQRSKNYDPQANILARWGSALLDLQQGLEDQGLDSRRTLFASAATKMMNVFEDVFGWGSELPQAPPNNRFYSSRRNSNLAFYTAKALWAFRCTFGRDPKHFSYDKDRYLGIERDLFIHRLDEALDVALCLFDYERNQYIPDPFIAAIYNFCVALVLTVRMSISDSEACIPFQSRSKDLSFWENYRERIPKKLYLAGSAEFWQNHRSECLDTAKELKKALVSMTTPGKASGRDSGIHIPEVIYVEGIEKLGDLHDFSDDIRLLDESIRDSQALFDFYTKGARPR